MNNNDGDFAGVRIGVQSYSFRDRDLDACLTAYQAVGIRECELWHRHAELREASHEALRAWRLSAPMSHFRAIRRKFEKARIRLNALNYGFYQDLTEAEFAHGFEMAQALGVSAITASCHQGLAPKVEEYARKYQVVVGFHNHAKIPNPHQFSTAETFERTLEGSSKWVGIALDVGHFVAVGQDPVAFLRKWHSRIVALHLKDRKRNYGPELPWGEGDTPLVALLRSIRDHHWEFPCNIEYEYNRPDLEAQHEVKKCVAICKEILASGRQRGSRRKTG